MKTTIDAKCPLCNGLLVSQPGTYLNKDDGITVECPHILCKMADWGHGKTETMAVAIFNEKCQKTIKNK